MLDKIKLKIPLNNPRITQGFGENPDIYARFGFPGHNGIDFGAPIGTPVYAAQSGSVKKTGYDETGYGNYVILAHKIGNEFYETLYAHLSSVEVTTNDYVSVGEKIGEVGSTGFSTGPHLHFELRVNQKYAPQGYKGRVDPTPMFMPIQNQVPTSEPSSNAKSVIVNVPLANIRSNADLSLESIIGQLKSNIVLDVIGVSGDFYQCTLRFYIHKSVVLCE